MNNKSFYNSYIDYKLRKIGNMSDKGTQWIILFLGICLMLFFSAIVGLCWMSLLPVVPYVAISVILKVLYIIEKDDRCKTTIVVIDCLAESLIAMSLITVKVHTDLGNSWYSFIIILLFAALGSVFHLINLHKKILRGHYSNKTIKESHYTYIYPLASYAIARLGVILLKKQNDMNMYVAVLTLCLCYSLLLLAEYLFIFYLAKRVQTTE